MSQKLAFPSATRAIRNTVVEQSLLPNSIPGVAIRAVSLVGPTTWKQVQAGDVNFVLLFLDGRGTYRAGGNPFAIDGETIARAPMGWDFDVSVPAGAILSFLSICKEISADDKADLARYPENNVAPWVKRFSECEAYREAIKSPKTISRTLLPANYVPRVALGTVETTGPDRVGEHRHPMLEQLFLGLRGNDITVHADGVEMPLGEFQLMAIPHASMHGATVAEGRKLHYVWMDFFSDKEGQAWLETHKPIPADEQPGMDG
jgi:hypothetical protein